MNKEVIIDSQEKQRIVFHFNKSHNQDASIPCWIVKHKGQTYYVNHMESTVGFSTKETPENDHTKAAIQFKGKLKIESENEIATAIIS